MFCYKCGTQLHDGAKFCHNCGANVIESISTQDPTPDSGTEIAPTSLTFLIQTQELSFDKSFEDYTMRRKAFLKQVQPFIVEEGSRIQSRIKNIISHAETHKSSRTELDKTLIAYYDYGTKAVDLFAKTIHEELIHEHIYSYTLDRVKERCEKAIQNFVHSLAEFSTKLAETMSMKNELEQARAMQRGSRSYWQGGGFGVANAIKGALTAGAMNVATNAVRGIGDSFVDSGDDNRIFKMKYKLLQSKPWAEILMKSLIKDSYESFKLLAAILESEGKLKCPVINEQKSDALYANSKYISDHSEKTVVLIQSIMENPYNANPYSSLLTEYDLSSDVIDLIDYFLDFHSMIWLTSAYTDTIVNRINYYTEAAKTGDRDKAQKEYYTMMSNLVDTIETKKDTNEFFYIYSTYMLPHLQKGKESAEEMRRTSSDGVVFDTIEERDRYEEEYPIYEKFCVEDPLSLSVEQEQAFINKAKAHEFKSKAIIEDIIAREKYLALRIDAQKKASTFEGCFAYVWPEKQENALKLMPEYMQTMFLSLKHGKDATVLACWAIENDGPHYGDDISETVFFVVSDYYIAAWSNYDLSTPVAVRTKDIKAVSIETPFGFSLFGDVIKIERYYSDEPIEIGFGKKEGTKAAVQHYVDILNKTIHAVRENVRGSMAAQTIEQHCADLATLSNAMVQDKFYEILRSKGDNWRDRDEKYVNSVLNVALKGLVSEEDVIIYLDTSLFRNGKAGIAITRSCFIDSSLVAVDRATKRIKLDYNHIVMVNLHTKDGALDGEGIEFLMDNGESYESKWFLKDEAYPRLLKFIRHILFLIN